MFKKIGICELISFICMIIGGFITDSNEDLAVLIILLALFSFIIGPIVIIIKNRKKTNVNDLKPKRNKSEKEIIQQNIKNSNEVNWIKKNKNFYINEETKQIKINNNIYDFNQILDYELIIDGTSINKADFGSVATRTLLFGSIIGGTTSKRNQVNYCTQLEIKITINNLKKPTEYINFMNGFRRINKSSVIYKNISKNAEDCMSILKIITTKK